MAGVDKGKRPMDAESKGKRTMKKEKAAGKVAGVDKGKGAVEGENNEEMAMEEENAGGKVARVYKGKRAVDKESNKINIKIYGQDGEGRMLRLSRFPLEEQLDGVLVTYNMRRNMQLKNLLLKYCERKQLDYKSTTFLYKCKRLLVRSTPEELRMKDGDQIEAMLHWRSG